MNLGKKVAKYNVEYSNFREKNFYSVNRKGDTASPQYVYADKFIWRPVGRATDFNLFTI